MIESMRAVCQRMKRITLASEKDIKLLFMMPCIYTRNSILYELSAKIMELEGLCNQLIEQENPNENMDGKMQRQVQQEQRNFTLEELSMYTGKDGNPAYVAVNGVVYDVTNNAAWAAASHFGLTAGKDLTSEFTSCHAGQSVLSKLIVVGKLI